MHDLTTETLIETPMSSEQRYNIEDLKRLMQRLRDPVMGCPWDLKQSFESIAPYTLEECAELIDALEQKDYPHVKEELGDVLFQVIFYSQLGAEQDLFDFDEVVSDITAKLIRRHPHVFLDGDLEGVVPDRSSMEEIKKNWEATKAAERVSREQMSVMDDVPEALPGLVRAQKLQKRAGQLGYDWTEKAEVVKAIEAEWLELFDVIDSDAPVEIEMELGDVLFSIVNLARHCRIDAEAALRKASRRFEARVRFAESQAAREGRDLRDESPETLDRRWRDAKQATDTL